MKEKIYTIGIYNNQNVLVDFIEVEAETKEEAEEIGYQEWLQGIEDRYYASAEEE